MSKWSDKSIVTDHSQEDWIGLITSLFRNKRIAIKNLKVQWNKIQGKPFYFPFDVTSESEISATWQFNSVIKTNAFTSSASQPSMQLDQYSAFVFTPSVNITIKLGSNTVPGRFSVFIKPTAANVVLTLAPGQFAYDTLPVISTTSNTWNILHFEYCDTLNRAVLIEHQTGLTLN